MEKEKSSNSIVNKTTLWKLTTGILGVLFVVSILTGGFGIVKTEIKTAKEKTAENILLDIKEEKIANKAVENLNNNILAAQGTSATLNKVSEESGLLKLNLTIQGQNVESYVSKDGKYLFSQAIDLTRSPTQTPTPTQSPQEPTPSPAQTPDIEVSADKDPVKGEENAPVTIVEFSDFECSYCGRFYTQTLGLIEEEYIETGKVKFVYKDFPLTSIHSNAQKAAEAGECADEQGKFWEMHDKLFEEGVKGGVETFKEYAEEIGLNTEKFNECIDSGKMAEEVAEDLQEGQAAGIRGTPGFIVNGQLISGAQPFSAFKQVIETELSE